MGRWIGYEPEEDVLLERLTGREAVLLCLNNLSHPFLLIGFRGRSRSENMYMRMHACTRIVAPTKWTVEQFRGVPVEPHALLLLDRRGEIQFECECAAVLSREEAYSFAGPSAEIRNCIDWLEPIGDG